MDRGRIAALRDRAQQWCDGYGMRSGVLLAARRGRIIFHEAYGPQTAEQASTSLQTNSIFSVASISKPITATAVLMLVEDGLLGLNRPLKEYLPEVCGPGTDDIEVQHLLTHTSGYAGEAATERISSAMAQHGDLTGDPEAALHKFTAAYLTTYWDLASHWSPGSQMTYSDHNYALLAEIVRRVSGKPLHTYSRERIFEPLGMTDTTGIRDDSKNDRQVRRGDDVLHGSVAGDPMAGLEGNWLQTAPWGFTGVSSTALDLAIFGQMFLNGGRYGDHRLLSRSSVHEMTRNQIPGISADMNGMSIEASWGLGWMVQANNRWTWANATLNPVGTFYHLGAGGLGLWIDPINEIVAVYLSVCLDIDLEAGFMRSPRDLFLNMVVAAIAEPG